MNVGCILMAAGAGQRFGGDKLLAEFKGAPLYAHALACIPAEAFAGVAVVAHAEAVLSAARRRGFCAREKTQRPQCRTAPFSLPSLFLIIIQGRSENRKSPADEAIHILFLK